MSERNAHAVIDAIRARLIAIADKPPYRFVNTSREDRAEYEAWKRSFTGYPENEIATVESKLNVLFPSVYRAYLRIMGITHGDLFRGSNVASLDDYAELRAFARELIEEDGSKWELDGKAIVFLEHQGYTFRYFIADGGYDSPIFQYVEGDESPKQCAAGFVEMLDAEVSLAEQNNQNSHDSGGYYLTVKDGCVSQNHPALASGVRPLDLPEDALEDVVEGSSDTISKPWWRFW